MTGRTRVEKDMNELMLKNRNEWRRIHIDDHRKDTLVHVANPNL